MTEFANKIYTPKELNELWDMPFSMAQRMHNLDKPYEFHVHCSELPDNPEKKQDRSAAQLIVRALLGDQENPDPPEPPAFTP